MKKKVLATLLATAMSVSMLAGCGSDSAADNTTDAADTTADAATETTEETSGDENADATADTVAADKVYKIGICQLLEHAALDAATEGFEAALVEKLGEGNVTFDFQNAQGEQTNCATICTQFVADDVDLILANATAPLQAAAAATNTIPILGTSVTDFATALDISDWTGKTGTNVSGTSDLAPLDEQEKMLKELFPDVKKVGILYCSAEANSVYQAQMFESYLDADGVAWEEFSAADSNEIQAIVTSAVESCDVLYLPTDNTMAANTETINNVAQPAGVPIIAGEEGICAGCGVATLSISYYDIGYTAGEMAYDILVNGADITTMDVKYAPQVTKEYNEAICSALGIEVPEDYVAIATE